MAWEQKCAQLNSQTHIFSLAEYNGRLYGGTYPNSNLFRLNETGDAWEQICAQLNGQTHIYSLAEYNSRLYGGTAAGGRLFRLNEAGDAWEQICARLNGQTHILSLAEYNSRLYGGTYPDGRLFRLNAAGDAWEQICAQLNSQSYIYSLAEYNGRLYGGTFPDGLLFRLNETGDAWEQICAQLNGQTHIYSLAEYNGRLYAGTYPGGRLFRLNETGDAWEQICAGLNGQTYINSLAEYNSRLYGGTATGGRLFRLNVAGDAWEQICAQLNGQIYINSLAEYNSRLYGGTAAGGRLFRAPDANRKILPIKPYETPFIEIPKGHPHCNGLVAEYLFNEQGKGVSDWTQNGNDLSIVNATWDSDENIGTGLRFDADGEYASLDNSKQLINSEEGTIIMWFKSLGSMWDGVDRVLFGKYGGVDVEGNFNILKTSSDLLSFNLTDSVGVHYVRITGIDVLNWQGGTQLAILWRRTAAIWNSDNMVINIDGVHVVPNAASGETNWNSYTVGPSLYVGNDSQGTTRESNGIIPHLSIYNKVLDEELIKHIYNNLYEKWNNGGLR